MLDPYNNKRKVNTISNIRETGYEILSDDGKFVPLKGEFSASGTLQVADVYGDQYFPVPGLEAELTEVDVVTQGGKVVNRLYLFGKGSSEVPGNPTTVNNLNKGEVDPLVLILEDRGGDKKGDNEKEAPLLPGGGARSLHVYDVSKRGNLSVRLGEDVVGNVKDKNDKGRESVLALIPGEFNQEGLHFTSTADNPSFQTLLLGNDYIEQRMEKVQIGTMDPFYSESGGGTLPITI